MNTGLIEPALTELLQNTRELKGELAEQREQLQSLLEQKANNMDAAILEKLLHTEIEKIRRELNKSSSQEGKSWTLFSNDFQAQNFKVVVETVCKWVAIICGSFYLLSSIFSLWK